MTSTAKGETKSPLIAGTIVLLIVYNLLYWIATLVKSLEPFLEALRKQWGLLSFLEFLAVASLVIDLTVRWDKFTDRQKRIHLIITFLIAASFFIRFVFGLIALYVTGEAK